MVMRTRTFKEKKKYVYPHKFHILTYPHTQSPYPSHVYTHIKYICMCMCVEIGHKNDMLDIHPDVQPGYVVKAERINSAQKAYSSSRKTSKLEIKQRREKNKRTKKGEIS